MVGWVCIPDSDKEFWSISLGQKCKNIFVCFLVQMKTLKSPFTINWSLVMSFIYLGHKTIFRGVVKLHLIFSLPKLVITSIIISIRAYLKIMANALSFVLSRFFRKKCGHDSWHFLYVRQRNHTNICSDLWKLPWKYG